MDTPLPACEILGRSLQCQALVSPFAKWKIGYVTLKLLFISSGYHYLLKNESFFVNKLKIPQTPEILKVWTKIYPHSLYCEGADEKNVVLEWTLLFYRHGKGNDLHWEGWVSLTWTSWTSGHQGSALGRVWREPKLYPICASPVESPSPSTESRSSPISHTWECGGVSLSLTLSLSVPASSHFFSLFCIEGFESLMAFYSLFHSFLPCSPLFVCLIFFRPNTYFALKNYLIYNLLHNS